MNDNGTFPNKTAVIFNITSPVLIRQWRNQFESGGIGALESKKKGRSTMKKNQTIKGSKEALEAENDM
jgi:transposase-like protein